MPDTTIVPEITNVRAEVVQGADYLLTGDEVAYYLPGTQ
jgi:hypothetical protein